MARRFSLRNFRPRRYERHARTRNPPFLDLADFSATLFSSSGKIIPIELERANTVSIRLSLSLFPQLIFLIYIEKECKIKFMNFSSPGDIILERLTRRQRLFLRVITII